ncbi:MAG: hypothetical protein ABSE20_19025 [Acetobacteraceae bacterium]|jgi:hypothetical protein
MRYSLLLLPLAAFGLAACVAPEPTRTVTTTYTPATTTTYVTPTVVSPYAAPAQSTTTTYSNNPYAPAQQTTTTVRHTY